MNLQANPVTASGQASAWQIDFVKHLLPRVKSHARFRFRDLPPSEREEAEAESVAVALVFFVRLVEQGRNPSAFAVRIARIAVLRVKSGRLVGSQQRSQDVLSRLARQRRQFHVESLDDCRVCQDGEWQAIVVEDRRSSPAVVAACKIDFGEWLKRMPRRRREIAELLAAGYRTEEVAEKCQLSRSRISQLRREFEISWHDYQRQAQEIQTVAA